MSEEAELLERAKACGCGICEACVFAEGKDQAMWTFHAMETPGMDFSMANRWILRIERPDGKIVLNPEIPQDEAVRAFVRLCNALLEASR